MKNEEIDKLLSTPIPGGSQARDWFLPHESERGLANVRDVVSRIVAADRESLAKHFEAMQGEVLAGDEIAHKIRTHARDSMEARAHG